MDSVIQMHSDQFGGEMDQLAIINLAAAFSKTARNKIETMGVGGLQQFPENNILATSDFVLISKTLEPPRLAYQAVSAFGILQRQLDGFLAGNPGESVDVIDVTSSFFETIEGKKPVHRLLKTITSSTPSIDVPLEYKGHKIKVKLVIGIDIPSRNQLARIGAGVATVTVLISASGPNAYTFSTVFNTEDGSAIFASPYTQFILQKKQVTHED